MKRFPRFLKTMPSIYGLSLFEIIGLVVGLYLAMIFRLSSLVTILVSLGLISIIKFLKRNFDLVGFLLPQVKQIHLDKFKGVGLKDPNSKKDAR